VDGALTLLGNVIGKPDRAAQLVSYIDGKQAIVADAVSAIPSDDKDGLYLSGSAPTLTFAGGKFHEEWASATGCNLVSAVLPSKPYKPEVNVEQISDWNPDLILLSNSLDPALVLTDEAWASIAAVENNRVYRIPRFVGDWASPVPESTLGLMWVANGTYHDYLDLNMVEETKAFYDTFYSYSMTDEEARTIMGAFPALHGREITDMAGNNVVIPYEVTKVVTLYPPAAAMVMAIDGGSADLLVGITHDAIIDDGFNDIDPTIAGKTEITFTDGVPNQETLLALDPDVIITKTCMPYHGFEDLGIPVVWIDTMHVEDIDGALALIGEVLEKPDRAANLVTYIQTERSSLLTSVPTEDPERLYLSGGSPLATFAGGRFHEEWANGAGCVLVSAGTQFDSYKPTVSIETIIGWDPEIIMLSNSLNPTDVLTNPQWENITAVENGRVYRVPRYVGDWASPVPESTLGMMLVANGTYTEVNLNMIEETQDFYTLFYNHALSEAEVIDIIGTPAPAPAPVPA
jgi:iron complex transport system substrate-binding protein